MPSYHRLGEVPAKRHTQFRATDGRLYAEEVFGTEGFGGRYSILYHRHVPAQVTSVERMGCIALERWDGVHRNHLLHTGSVRASGDPVTSRVPLLFNEGVIVSVARATEPQLAFYKNGTRDELLFVHEGRGVLATQFGELSVRPGDYVYVPRGTVQRLTFEDDEGRLLIVEACGSIATPRRYRNDEGQLLEHAPYSERDFRKPERLVAYGEATQGPFEVRVKIGDDLYCHEVAEHPFDVVGWDGYCYPFAFNIQDFEPVAGRLHVPPTAHQTFEGPGFVVCSFVPRKLDWDAAAVPVPYYHQNLDSDEVIYYVAGTYTARKVESGSMTVHPRGLAHGPAAGAPEASLNRARETDEVAVMIDTFHPLRLAAACRDLDDPAYLHSWDRASP